MQHASDRLRPVRQLLAIFLLAFLPLQFSWAAVASYCAHETQAGADHFGHHENHADAGSVADRATSPVSTSDVEGETAPGAMELDCGHCHSYCSVMLTLPSNLPGPHLTALPNATLVETGGSHAPTRPERPQWLPLA